MKYFLFVWWWYLVWYGFHLSGAFLKILCIFIVLYYIVWKLLCHFYSTLPMKIRKFIGEKKKEHHQILMQCLQTISRKLPHSTGCELYPLCGWWGTNVMPMFLYIYMKYLRHKHHSDILICHFRFPTLHDPCQFCVWFSS